MYVLDIEISVSAWYHKTPRGMLRARSAAAAAASYSREQRAAACGVRQSVFRGGKVGSLKIKISQIIQKPKNLEKKKEKKNSVSKGSAGAHCTQVQKFRLRVCPSKKRVDIGL